MGYPTALELVTDSLELLSVYAPGEQISSADADRMRHVLNDMLDAWSNLTLSCYAIQTINFPLVPMQQQYTIGPGGSVNTTRPLKLITGPGCAYVTDFNGNRYGVSVIPEDQWNMLGNVSNLVTSNFPDTIFYDPQFPLGILWVFPWPSIAYTMTITTYLQFSDLPNLTAQLVLPPGYKRAIVTNLAVCAKPYFASAQIDPLIVAEALMRHGDIKRTNMRPNVAVMEPEMVSRARLSYNIYTDRPGNTT